MRKEIERERERERRWQGGVGGTLPTTWTSARFCLATKLYCVTYKRVGGGRRRERERERERKEGGGVANKRKAPRGGGGGGEGAQGGGGLKCKEGGLGGGKLNRLATVRVAKTTLLLFKGNVQWTLEHKSPQGLWQPTSVMTSDRCRDLVRPHKSIYKSIHKSWTHIHSIQRLPVAGWLAVSFLFCLKLAGPRWRHNGLGNWGMSSRLGRSFRAS